MNKATKIMGLVMLLCLSAPWAARAQTTPEILVDKARIVIEEMLMSQDQEAPLDLIQRSSALVIVPGMIKGGFVVGGAYGKGIVVARGPQGWSAPAFVYLGAGSFGLQIGAELVDLILVVMGDDTLDSILKAKGKLGADVALAAGPIGAQVTAATDILLKGGVFSYSRSRGLFAGVSIEGAVIDSDLKFNRDYYRKVVLAPDVFAGKVSPPESARRLQTVLEGIPKG